MNTPRAKVYDAIDAERDYQDRRWPQGPTDQLSIGEQILLIEEYAALARHAWSRESDGPETKALDTMRKIAAIAVHCMEDHGILFRSTLAAEKSRADAAEASLKTVTAERDKLKAIILRSDAP